MCEKERRKVRRSCESLCEALATHTPPGGTATEQFFLKLGMGVCMAVPIDMKLLKLAPITKNGEQSVLKMGVHGQVLLHMRMRGDIRSNFVNVAVVNVTMMRDSMA